MPQLEDFEDPTFATDFVPPDLQRRRCDNCSSALADCVCRKCSRLLCSRCELDVHHEMEIGGARREELEESKGDGRPHQEYLAVVNVCEDCGRKGADFLCVTCGMYQCSACSMDKHFRTPNNGNHMYFSIEGSSPALICCSQWSQAFIDMGLDAYRRKCNDAGGKFAGAVLVKTEPLRDPVMPRLESLSIQSGPVPIAAPPQPGPSQPAPPQPVLPQPAPPQAPQPGSSAKTAFVVDLTESDDEGQSASASVAASSAGPYIKSEPIVKAERAVLPSAPVTITIDDLDDLLGEILENDDLVLRTMIREYNKLSVQIHNMESESNQLRQRARSTSNMEQIIKLKGETQAHHRRMAEVNQERNEIVAKIVVCIKSDPTELKALLDECTLNITHAQINSHKQCAILEAQIRDKLLKIRRLHDDMTSALTMKNSSEEIKRIGAMIAQEETETRELDRSRTEEFLRLCSFSEQIQVLVRKISGAAA